MATARRAYFRVPTSILREDWSDADLATMVRLQATMVDRWARDGLTGLEASTIHLGYDDVAKISRKRRRDVALTSVQHCADLASMSVQLQGEVVVIFWPKFSEFQGLNARDRGKDGAEKGLKKPRSAPAPAPAPADALKDKEREPLPAPKGADFSLSNPVAAKKRNGKTFCPPIENQPEEWIEKVVQYQANKDKRVSRAQAWWALSRVAGWSETNQKMKVNWPLVASNAIDEGWGLKGFMP